MEDTLLRFYRQSLELVSSQLTELLERARKDYPNAEIYITPNHIYLLSGAHHEGRNAEPRHDRELARAALHGAIDMGDW